MMIMIQKGVFLRKKAPLSFLVNIIFYILFFPFLMGRKRFFYCGYLFTLLLFFW